jgi:NitT/TauT family transport system permease protein
MLTGGKFFTPNAKIDRQSFLIMVAVEIFISLLVWWNSPVTFIPKPLEVWQAFGDLWDQGLLINLITSLWLNTEAVIMATALSLLIAWAGTIPIFRAPVQFIGKLRYVSMAGLLFAFTLVTRNGHQLKLTVLVWAVTVFFVVSMVGVLENIPRESFDHCRVIHKRPWRILWEIQVLGTADKAFDVMQQNIAMAWLTLAFAEAISRSEGGVGAMLATSAKYFHLSEIAALQIVIFSMGLMQDYALGWFKRACCPYAFLVVEAR